MATNVLNSQRAKVCLAPACLLFNSRLEVRMKALVSIEVIEAKFIS